MYLIKKVIKQKVLLSFPVATVIGAGGLRSVKLNCASVGKSKRLKHNGRTRNKNTRDQGRGFKINLNG